jgi:hypothetical protein
MEIKMPILNSVYKGKKLFASEFFCINCFVVRPYHIKPVSNEMTFYLIPFLEKNEANDVVVCQVCQNAFHPDVLKRNIQGILKIVGAAKVQLDQGTSPRYLKLRLISDGLQESFADKLVSMAMH